MKTLRDSITMTERRIQDRKLLVRARARAVRGIIIRRLASPWMMGAGLLGGVLVGRCFSRRVPRRVTNVTETGSRFMHIMTRLRPLLPWLSLCVAFAKRVENAYTSDRDVARNLP